MLDKSVEYAGFIMKMRREKLARLTVPELPEGYSFRFYTPGDEHHWAGLKTLVNEFESPKELISKSRGTGNRDSG